MCLLLFAIRHKFIVNWCSWMPIGIGLFAGTRRHHSELVCSYYDMLGYDTIHFIRFEYEIKMYRMHLTISSLRSILRWTGWTVCKANAKIRHSNSGPNLILFHVFFQHFSLLILIFPYMSSSTSPSSRLASAFFFSSRVFLLFSLVGRWCRYRICSKSRGSCELCDKFPTVDYVVKRMIQNSKWAGDGVGICRMNVVLHLYKSMDNEECFQFEWHAPNWTMTLSENQIKMRAHTAMQSIESVLMEYAIYPILFSETQQK